MQMWEVVRVYDSVGSMFRSWRVGRLRSDGTMEWAGNKTKNKEIAILEAEILNEKEKAK